MSLIARTTRLVVLMVVAVGALVAPDRAFADRPCPWANFTPSTGAAGTIVTIQGQGCGVERVEFEFRPRPYGHLVFLGAAIKTSPSGVFRVRRSIPADAAPGKAFILVNFPNRACLPCAQLFVESPFIVKASPAALPYTGLPIGTLIWIALGLVLTGTLALRPLTSPQHAQ